MSINEKAPPGNPEGLFINRLTELFFYKFTLA